MKKMAAARISLASGNTADDLIKTRVILFYIKYFDKAPPVDNNYVHSS